jgi:hypothetical protein
VKNWCIRNLKIQRLITPVILGTLSVVAIGIFQDPLEGAAPRQTQRSHLDTKITKLGKRTAMPQMIAETY